MTKELSIAVAQLNLLVGDIEANTQRVITVAKNARDVLNADLVVFPELTLTSYPPEDLLLRPGLYRRVDKAVKTILSEVQGIDLIIGHPTTENEKRFNSASLLRNGEVISTVHKHRLPNYSVFDEARYFTPGDKVCVVDIKGIQTGLTICEDLWYEEPMLQAKDAGAQLMISINASPFDLHKPNLRQKIMSERAQQGHMPILYVNLVGGQDELVFDGGSMAISDQGELIYQAPFYQESIEVIRVTANESVHIITSRKNAEMSEEKRIYDALVLGVRDYIQKNHFPGAVIGLSGGVDSALTLAIAVDAIGPERVEGVLMPSRYTSEMSIEDATTQSVTLGVKHQLISIEPIFESFLESLRHEFTGLPEDATEENLQARCRGTLLMAISNKKGSIVLSTGNKSELAVGYSTLYGDMVGGFCVLKDVPKTLVYRLVKYRNSLSHVIPQRVIDRPPSAELAENQTDQDTLPPYDILDQILERYIEHDEPADDIVKAGFNRNIVYKVMRMVARNEYKRHQAPLGVKISQKAFGRDRRYPITSGYSNVYHIK